MGRISFAFFATPMCYALLALIGGDEGTVIFVVTLVIWGMNVLIGTPLVLLLRKMNWLQWWHFTGCGAALGAGLAAVFFGTAYGSSEAILAYLAVGAIHGALIWLIGAFRNDALRKA